MSHDAEQPIAPPEGPAYCPECGSSNHRLCDPDRAYEDLRGRLDEERRNDHATR